MNLKLIFLPFPALITLLSPGTGCAQTSVVTGHGFNASATAAEPTVPDLLENSTLLMHLTYTNGAQGIIFRGTSMDSSLATADDMTWTVKARDGYRIDSLDDISATGNFSKMNASNMGGIISASLDGGSNWTNLQTINHTGLQSGGSTPFDESAVNFSSLVNAGTQTISLRLNLRDTLGDGAAADVTWALTHLSLRWTVSSVPEPTGASLLISAGLILRSTRRASARRSIG